jgi:peptidoglycan hydrolase CwlO-like protein
VALFEQIQSKVGDFSKLELVDAKKLFPETFDARVSEITNGLEKLKNKIDTIDEKQGKITALTSEITQLETEIK